MSVFLVWNGRWLIADFTAGKIPQIAAKQLLLKGEPAYRRVLGGSFVPREPGRNMGNFKLFFVWQTTDKLKPIVALRHALGGAVQTALGMLDRKITDKAVLIS